MSEEMTGKFLRQVEQVLKIWSNIQAMFDFVEYFVVFLIPSLFSLINGMITFVQ